MSSLKQFKNWISDGLRECDHWKIISYYTSGDDDEFDCVKVRFYSRDRDDIENDIDWCFGQVIDDGELNWNWAGQYTVEFWMSNE